MIGIPKAVGKVVRKQVLYGSTYGKQLHKGKDFNFNWKWFQNIYAWMYKVLKQQADKNKADGRTQKIPVKVGKNK